MIYNNKIYIADGANSDMYDGGTNTWTKWVAPGYLNGNHAESKLYSIESAQLSYEDIQHSKLHTYAVSAA